MSLQNATFTRTARHRAEDDLFHFDRSRAPKPIECSIGLSSAKNLGSILVVSLRPRWLVNQAQTLIRSRCEGCTLSSLSVPSVAGACKERAPLRLAL